MTIEVAVIATKLEPKPRRMRSDKRGWASPNEGCQPAPLSIKKKITLLEAACGHQRARGGVTFQQAAIKGADHARAFA
jgi:hypothetical protein